MIKLEAVNIIKELSSEVRKIELIVKDLTFKVEESTLNICDDDSEILRCLKYEFKENNNILSYRSLSELIDTNSIIYNNFIGEGELIKGLKFEFRNCLNFNSCEYIYYN